MEEPLVISSDHPLSTYFLGEYVITKTIQRAIEKRINVLRPIIECRYDLVLDDGLSLFRTQVKYAGRSSPKTCKGVVPVNLNKWRNGGRRGSRCYTSAEIDLLLVYVRKIDKILRFGPEIFEGKGVLFIRIEPTLNNQSNGCLLASDFVW